jgi:radical SAM superfamily enzyme YgiQ (UPF0313 family)
MKKNNQILLINSWIYDFTAYDLWIKPIGLLYIGSVLRNFGYEINLVDCMDKHNPELLKLQGLTEPKIKKYGNGHFYREVIEKPEVYKDIPRKYARYGITPEIFIKELKKQKKPDVILVTSVMTYWYLGVKDAIKILKEEFPGVPIILGGVYATLCWEHAVKNSGVDVVVKGEGELQALMLVDKFTKNESDLSKFPNRFDDLPYPAFDLYRKLDFMVIMTSKGCPFTCSFCATHNMFDAYVQRTREKVVDEIEYWYKKYNIENFVFYDDALFIKSQKHIEKILDGIYERDIKINFHTPNGLFARFITPSLAEKMYRTGFKTIRLSLETTSEERQKEDMSSKVSNISFATAIQNLENAGYRRDEIEVYLLMGLPNQSFNEVKESIDYVASLGAITKIHIFSPIPGTKDWEKIGWSKNTDPLLSNKSIFPLKSKEQTYQMAMEMKEYAMKMNQKVKGKVESREVLEENMF